MEFIDTVIFSHHFTIETRDNSSRDYRQNTEVYREYRRKFVEYPKKKIIGEFPLHLDIEITNRCNLRCPMCFINVVRQEFGFMTFDTFRRIIDEGISHHLYAINLCWFGEPLLHPECFKFIRYAKDKGILDIRMNSNGSLLDGEKIQQLLDSGLDLLIVSINGATKESYERMRKGVAYEKVVKNIEQLVEQRDRRGSSLSINLQFLHMKPTEDEVELFIKRWKGIVDSISILLYRNALGEEGEKYRVEDRPELVFPCPQLWQRLVLSWNGDIHMCCSEFAKEKVLGNVYSHSIQSIWKGDELNRIRKAHIDNRSHHLPICRKCEINKYPKNKKDWGFLNKLLTSP